MTQREMNLLRALTAAQAALWEVIDGEHNALNLLSGMMMHAMTLAEELAMEKKGYKG